MGLLNYSIMKDIIVKKMYFKEKYFINLVSEEEFEIALLAQFQP